MATKRQADQIWAPALTLRLEPELADRLRNFCYQRRLKKQPVLRLALQRFLKATGKKRAGHLERLRIAPIVPLEAKEKLVLERDEFETLRRFVFEYNTHKQTVMRLALIEYLDAKPKV
jgi:hypothetical protein